jgi:Carboxypeptidase regulatory-like domain
MRRVHVVQVVRSGLAGISILLIGLLVAASGTAATADAQSAAVPAGLISGQVTDSAGQPLAGITVAAAPAGNESDAPLTLGTTDANGDYALVLAPGSYDVAFNAISPTDGNYAAQVYGGPGPSASDTCQVCFGTPQVVTNGVNTAGISVVLVPFGPTGTVRPLSGDVIAVADDRIPFRFGCHEDGLGCEGKATLRIGTSTKDPVVSSESFEVAPDHSETLHLTVPSSVRAELKRAKHNKLAAIVELSTQPDSTVTKFTLVDR